MHDKRLVISVQYLVQSGDAFSRLVLTLSFEPVYVAKQLINCFTIVQSTPMPLPDPCNNAQIQSKA